MFKKGDNGSLVVELEDFEGWVNASLPKKSSSEMVNLTSIETGWCVNGLTITPEGTWSCSVCDEPVSTDNQTTKGGWFDYDSDGKLGFVHFDCYQHEKTLKLKREST